MAKKNSATLDDLLRQAVTTNRLLAAQLKDKMSQQDLVNLLMSTGLTNQELASVLDTTPATVAATLQRLKKRAAAKAKETIPPSAGDGGGGADING
jgi:CRP-like cAMP-binding protein